MERNRYLNRTHGVCAHAAVTCINSFGMRLLRDDFVVYMNSK